MIALLTKKFSLRDLQNEQASGRGVLRLSSNSSLQSERTFAKAGIRLFCQDSTEEQTFCDLRRAIPKARAYTRGTYLRDRKGFVESLGIVEFGLKADLLDLLLVILCEMHESGHPVYLIIDDDQIASMLVLSSLLNDLYELVCQRMRQDVSGSPTVFVVPASSCLPPALHAVAV